MTYEHSIQVLPPSPDASRQEIARLQSEVCDLQIALLTSNGQTDLLEKDLRRLSVSFTAEVREREAAEEKLQKLVKAITQEKCDLEILVQILSDQGDIS